MMTGLPDEVLSTAQVKEEGQTAYQAETDTEGEDEDIDLDNLQPLTPTLASRSKFPIGCRVWYNVGNSKTQPKIIRAKAAIVAEVYFLFGIMKYVYKVKSEAPTEHEIILYEHKLVYAIGCPVKIEKSSTNGAVDGIIVAPNVDKGEDGCRVVTYSVQYSGEEEGSLTIESGIAAERIKYRGNEVEAHNKSEFVQGNKLKEATTEDKEVHGETREDISPRRSNAAETTCTAETTRTVDMKSDTLSKKQALSSTVTASDSLKQPDQMANRWEPPLSSELRRGSELEATERPSKFAKIVDNSKVTYEVLVPSWMPNTKSGQKGTLFGHLIGVGGEKTKAIRSETGCNIHILDKQAPMKIVFTSSSVQNVQRAFGMMEQSLVEFLSDENSTKRLIYELATSAEGSHNIHETSSGLLQRHHNGARIWWFMIEFPPMSYTKDECLYRHGKCLEELELQDTGCRVELFCKRFGSHPPKHAASYVLVSGKEEANVNVAITRVMKTMKKHQQRGCSCLSE